MKFSFLGTSHDTPAADRFTSCHLLEMGGSLYIFDAGAPVTCPMSSRWGGYRGCRQVF